MICPEQTASLRSMGCVAELRRYILCDLALGPNGRYRRKTDPNYGRAGLAMSEEEVAPVGKVAEEFLINALRKIACPIMLVRGAHTDILERDTAVEMVGLMKDGRLVEMDAQHSVFQETPADFAAAVVDFVSSR